MSILKRGYVYKWHHQDYPNDFYIGSTHSYYVRLKVHKHVCETPSCKNYNNKVYKFIRENEGA